MLTTDIARKQHNRERVLLLAIILLAAALRTWQLNVLPPGLFFDEAFNGSDARSVIESHHFPLYFVGNNGREPLFIYWQTLFVWLLGYRVYALRFAAAFVGIVTIPVVYWCTRMIFAPATTATEVVLSVGERANKQQQAGWLALLAAACLAVSYWHVSLSRLGFRAGMLPMLSALAIAYFWQAWRNNRRRNYLWAGFWLAAALYTYTSARLVPFVVLLFLLRDFIADILQSNSNNGGWRGLLRRWLPRLRGLFWLVGVSLLCLLPLFYAFYQDPTLIAARTEDVSIFTAAQRDMPGTPTERFAYNLSHSLLNFYTTGDMNARHNLPGRPVNDWLLALLFTAGWLTALWHWRQPQMRLLMLWLFVMLIPTLFSTEAPHALRSVGLLSPLVMLCAVGGGTLLQWSERSVRTPWKGILPVALVLIVSGSITTRDYFWRWARLPELSGAFQLERRLAAETIAAARMQNSYMLTTRQLLLTPQMRFIVGQIERHDQEGGALLPEAVINESRFLIEDHADPLQDTFLLTLDNKHLAAAWVAAPPSGNQPPLITQILRNIPGKLITSPIHQPGWRTLQTGTLAGSGIQIHSGQIRYPLQATFTNGMQLMGYNVQPDRVDPGQAEPVFYLTTYWRTATQDARPNTADFDVFNHLSFGNGLAQDNGPLGNGYPLSFWQPVEIVTDRRMLNVPVDAQHGKAYFEIGLFTLTRNRAYDLIGIVDGNGQVTADHVQFGAVAIGIDPQQVDLSDLQPVGVVFDNRIELAGWQTNLLASENVLQVSLGWRATDRSVTDYTAFVHLLDKAGKIVSQYDRPPGGNTNLTTAWLPGETARNIFPLPLPAGLVGFDPTQYQLRIGLYEPVSGKQLPVTVTAGQQTEVNATFVLFNLH